MMSPRGPKAWLIWVMVGLLLTAGALQFWSAWATRNMVMKAINGPAVAQADLEREKVRQDLISRQIENGGKALFQTNLASAIGAGFGVVISISGALIALLSYFDAREKDRIDRLQLQDKERADRVSAALSEALARLVGAESRERAVGAASLLQFFSPDKSEVHLQALSALVAAARSDGEAPEVRQGLRLAIEQAARSVDHAVLQRLSWQGVRLPDVDLAGCNLAKLDLRDAVLQNARLDRASLAGANLTAAKLQGAHLVGADLTGADLTYADLAGATLAQAHLSGARIDGAGVLNLDLDQTDFRGVESGWRNLPWDATRNWRRALFDPAVRTVLDQRYGPEAPALNVVMLMWEAPPYVAGGTWTACYHLVRKLRRRGAAVTVVMPWPRERVEDNPFGVDVPLVGLGVVAPAEAISPYAASPYWSDPAWSPYARGGVGAYGAASPSGGSQGFGPYASSPYAVGSPYGPYGGSAFGDVGLAGSILYRLIGEFRRRLQAWAADQKPDLIHAHDWVTFDAARAASNQTGAPWIAHFHSTEAERNPGAEDDLTRRIEQMAVDAATRVITPSQATRAQLASSYGAPLDRVDIVPNALSDGAPSTADMGRFETKKVLFLGRLSPQKGLDRFGAVAQVVRRTASWIQFEVVGEGEDRSLLSRYGLNWKGSLPWARRGEAFAGASAIVVPSRFEPFGMVILEGMQHRVPVLYPATSGAAEVLESGVKVDAGDIDAMAADLVRLLGDLPAWEAAVRAQAAEIDLYPARDYEDRLIAVWRGAASAEAGSPGSMPVP